MIVELMVSPEKLHLLQRDVNFLNRTPWQDATFTYGERTDGLQTVAIDVVFPKIGEFTCVGWVQHKTDNTVVPLHLEQTFEIEEQIASKICDLLGRRQSRNETWLLVDPDARMICCGPAGALMYGVERYELAEMTRWFKLLHTILNKVWGVSEFVPAPPKLTNYLAAVHASIRMRGFIPKSAMDHNWLRYEQIEPTYFHALKAMTKPSDHPMSLDVPTVIDVTEADRAVALMVINFIRSWTLDALDDFQKLLFKAASEDVVQMGVEAAAAFAVVEWFQQQSTYFGEVGERVEVDLIPIVRVGLKKSTLYKFLTADGHLLTWFSNRFDEPMRVGRYRVHVMAHEIYQGITQTRVDVTPYDRDRSLWQTDIRTADEYNMDYVVTDKDGRVVYTNFWLSPGEGAIKHIEKRVAEL